MPTGAMDDDPGRLPPGHVERRQVSNEVLAFQLTTLQEAQTLQSALLRDDIKEGFARMQSVLDKHTDQIGSIYVQLANMDARTTALEAYRAEIEAATLKETERVAQEARTASVDQNSLRMLRLLVGLLIGALTIGSMAFALLQGVH